DGAAERRLKSAALHTGIAQRSAHRGDAEVGDRTVRETSEGMDADARYLDRDRHVDSSARLGLERVGHDLPAVLIDVQRYDHETHGHAEGERARTCRETADDLQALRKLDDAEAERHLARVAGRPVRDRREENEFAVLTQRARLTVLRGAIQTVGAGRKVI